MSPKTPKAKSFIAEQEQTLSAELKRLRGLLHGIDAWGRAAAHTRPRLIARVAELEERLEMWRAVGRRQAQPESRDPGIKERSRAPDGGRSSGRCEPMLQQQTST